VSAIGSLPTSGTAPVPGSSTAGIEAQITRYKKELADCVNCGSANTTEGKAAIEAAARKVSIAEARIEKISKSSQIDAQAAAEAAMEKTKANDSLAKAYDGALIYENTVGIESGAAAQRSADSAGTLVDVFA